MMAEERPKIRIITTEAELCAYIRQLYKEVYFPARKIYEKEKRKLRKFLQGDRW